MLDPREPAGEIAPALPRIAVLIPAWQPEPQLVALVAELRSLSLGLVMVVDDGSDQASQPVFHALRQAGTPVLRHAVNLGKGRALKTGFNALLAEYPAVIGVVTADADGQHTPEDIARVAAALGAHEGRAVLGTRGFTGKVPLRSRFGNTLTRDIFSLVTGARLQDTQSGLRGLPVTALPALLRLEGERYEYEMTMLAHLCRSGLQPLEIPIQTVYIEGNRGSHFDPIWDSMRIYFVLARYYMSSLIAAAIDLLGFGLCFAVTHNLLLSVMAGRLSSFVNFLLNRKFVFHNQRSVAAGLWRYYVLAVAVAGLSYEIIRSITNHLHSNVFATKIAVDALLSLVSFALQRTFVFRRKQEAV